MMSRIDVQVFGSFAMLAVAATEPGSRIATSRRKGARVSEHVAFNRISINLMALDDLEPWKRQESVL